jgi:hypothetical protein
MPYQERLSSITGVLESTWELEEMKTFPDLPADYLVSLGGLDSTLTMVCTHGPVHRAACWTGRSLLRIEDSWMVGSHEDDQDEGVLKETGKIVGVHLSPQLSAKSYRITPMFVNNLHVS